MNDYHSITLLCLTFFLFIPSSQPISDYSTLVYKSCASQTFNNPQSQSYSQSLNSLFQQLITQSSQYKFFKTNEAINDETAIISGLFQCRDDMTRQDCFSCVNSLPHISNTLCENSIQARIQLEGCYIQYETEEVVPTGETETESSKISSSNLLLHKECGEPIEGLKELMDEAFVILETGILKSDEYYYTTSYGSVKLMGQCEGDSGNCECSECVSDAVHVAKEECGGSISAQIYLGKCFISYVYEPGSDGFPRNSIPGNLYILNQEPKSCI